MIIPLCSRNFKNVKLRHTSVEVQEFNCHPILRELNFGKIGISKIAFLTITVCDDKSNEVHDNWALIENLFNFVDYSCYSTADSIKFGKHCNLTEQLRNDFKFLFESIVNVQVESLLKSDNLNQSLNFISDGIPRTAEFSRLLRIANEVVSSGNMSMEDLEKLPVEYFNKILPYNEVSLLLKT